MILRPFSVSRLRALSFSTALTVLAVVGVLATSSVPRDVPRNVDGIVAPAAAPAAQPPTVTLNTTYGFSALSSTSTPANNPDGVEPSTLIPDGQGSFLGAAENGGTADGGTVFRIGTDGTFSLIYTFSNTTTDGGLPTTALTADGLGNFYGTASQGGPNLGGVVYKIDATGTFSVVYPFQLGSEGGDTNGTTPESALVLDAGGNLYGTTETGGDEGGGTVYQITPGGTLTVLHRFDGSPDGNNPAAALVPDGNGGFLGSTAEGGAFGSGTIYRVTPAGGYTLLYNFSATNSDVGTNNDGVSPNAALVSDGKGNFYGVAPSGGLNARGTIFKFTTDDTVTGSVLTPLYSFSAATYNDSTNLYDNNDGANPQAALIYGLDGNLYGTTENGGADGYGTVFEVAPDGTFTVLYTFTGQNDGASPVTSLVQTSTTDFYGTTSQFSPIIPDARVRSSAVKPLDNTSNMNGTVFHLSVIPAAGVLAYDTIGNASESSGTANIAVARTNGVTTLPGQPRGPGGSTGVVTVTYSTVDGTAKAGTDYTATSGTLTWADGDTADKVISVPITDRKLTTGNVFLNVVLGKPTGGAVLSGASDTALAYQLNIADNDTPTPTPTPAPVITSSATASGQVGQPFSYQIVASNAPTSYNASGLPDGLSLNGVTGLISGTPTVAKIYTAVLTASNAGGSNSLTVTFTIAAVTIPVPVINSPASANAQVGVPFAYQITASNNPVSFGTSALPDGLSANIATGLISGTPTAVGNYTITLSAANAGGTGTGTLALAVTASQSQATLAITSPPDGITVTVGESVPLAASFTDPDSATAGVQFLFNGSPAATAGADGFFTATATAAAVGTSVPVTVNAQDAAGRTFSATVHVNVIAADAANPVPTVSLLTPINARFFKTGTILTITATADNLGSTVGLDHVTIYVDGQPFATFDASGNLLSGGSGTSGSQPVRQDAASTPLTSLFTTNFPMPGVSKLIAMLVTATDKLGHTGVSNVTSFHSQATTDDAPVVSFNTVNTKEVVHSINPVNIVASDPDASGTSATARGPVRQDAASDATLAELEYWINGQQVADHVKANGQDPTTLPASFTPPAAGKYVFHAVSTDASGLATVSAPIFVEADPATAAVMTLGDGLASEGSENGKVAIRLNSVLTVPMTVRYKVAGSAQKGVNYKAGPITGLAVIPAGATQTKVKIKPLDTPTLSAGSLTVAKVKLLPSLDGSYSLGTPAVAKVKITDND